MWNGINRRRFPRAKYQCVITIKKSGEITKIYTTYTENIGMGGICVILKESISLFKRVELEILLKNGNPPVRCEGSVVWVVKRSEEDTITFDIGIEFINIKAVDRDRVEKVVEKILSSP